MAPMYDVVISYARQDTQFARVLTRALEDSGLRVWFDRDVLALGDRWDVGVRDAVERAAAVVVIVSPEWTTSEYAHEELNVALRSGRPILPILYGRADVPYELQHIHHLRINDENDLGRALSSIVDTIRTLSPSIADSGFTETTGLADTAIQFFREAGREVQRASNAQLLEPPGAWVCGADVPDATEVRSFAPFVNTRGRSAYFCYQSHLTADAEAALDELRIRGTPVVPLSSRTMRSALADGTTKDLLRELEHDYAARDNLFETLNALIDERFMFGRAQLLTRLGSALRNGEHVLLTGLRKAGKTSVLNIVRQHLDDRPVCMADLQRYDRQTEDWPPLLFSLMLDAYDRWATSTLPDWPFEPVEVTSATELQAALARRHAWQRTADIPAGSLVVVLDEIERVFPGAGENAAAAKFRRAAGALRAIGQGSDRLVSVIAADLRPVANRTNLLPDGETNPFFNWLIEVPVPVLTEEATRDMIGALARAMGIRTVSPAFAKAVYERSGGHPALARIMAGAAARNRTAPDRLDTADLQRGVAELDETDRIGSFLKQNFWDLTSATERQALLDLALEQRKGGLRAALRRRRTVDTIAGKEAIGNLAQQGLVRNGRVTIGAYVEWLTDHADELVAGRV